MQDRSSDSQELQRLQVQDKLATIAMGGALPEQEEPEHLRRVLDVGCGTGYWLLEATREYPEIGLLIGVDVSKRMIDYAREQALAQQVGNRVEFHVMDALQVLEFPEEFFDLINLRFGWSFVRTWDWPRLLDEFRRMTQVNGIIRITESDINSNNSPALTRLWDLAQETFFQAGHLFHNQRDGVISELPALLSRYGIADVHTRSHELTFQAGTPQGDLFIADMKHLFRTILPFLRRRIRVPEDYEQLYQQALVEMQQPDFVAHWHLLTAWGKNTSREKPAAARNA